MAGGNNAVEPPNSNTRPRPSTGTGIGTNTSNANTINTRKSKATNGISISDSDTEITNAREARKYLIDAGYLTKDTITPGTLKLITLQISECLGKLPKTSVELLRALAFTIESVEIQSNNEITSKVIAKEINAALEQHKENGIEENQKLLQAVDKATSEMNAAREEFRTQSEALTSHLRNQHLNYGKYPEEQGDATHHSTSQHEQPIQKPTYPTYANVLASNTHHSAHLPVGIVEILERNESKHRQILLDMDPTLNAHGIDELNELDLVKKANLAINLMGIEAGDAPKDTRFVGAKKMKGGAILLHVNSTAAANWLKCKDVMKSFIAHMGGDTIFRERSYQIIAQFVPIAFNPNISQDIRKIESDNDLTPLSIVNARYIKPVERRAEGQKTAHVILTINTPDDANKAIRRGLYVNGRKVPVRKSINEPRRCHKCQKVGAGHLAVTCKAPNDICPKCGDAHRVSDCKTGDRILKCVNCKETGHGSADRNCSYFLKRLTQHLDRDPSNKYKYFPTNSPDTWERNNGLDDMTGKSTILMVNKEGEEWSRPETRTNGTGRSAGKETDGTILASEESNEVRRNATTTTAIPASKTVPKKTKESQGVWTKGGKQSTLTDWARSTSRLSQRNPNEETNGPTAWDNEDAEDYAPELEEDLIGEELDQILANGLRASSLREQAS